MKSFSAEGIVDEVFFSQQKKATTGLITPLKVPEVTRFF